MTTLFILQASGDAHGDVVSSWIRDRAALRLAVGAGGRDMTLGSVAAVLVWSRAAAELGAAAFLARMSASTQLIVVQIGEADVPAALSERGTVIGWGAGLRERVKHAVGLAVAQKPLERAGPKPLFRVALGVLAALGLFVHGAKATATPPADPFAAENSTTRSYAFSEERRSLSALDENDYLGGLEPGPSVPTLDLSAPISSDAPSFAEAARAAMLAASQWMAPPSQSAVTMPRLIGMF